MRYPIIAEFPQWLEDIPLSTEHIGRRIITLVNESLPPVKHWPRQDIEGSLDVVLSEEWLELWSVLSTFKVMADLIDGQGGFISYPPTKTLILMQEQIWGFFGKQDFVKGDLIVGQFLGFQDFPILRCDPQQSDFGQFMVGDPMLPREEWQIVGTTLLDFVYKYVENNGLEYWA